MNKDKKNNDKIELRSEKVRELIGEMPSSLYRWSIAIITTITIAIIAAVSFLPYPDSNEESILQHFINLFLHL